MLIEAYYITSCVGISPVGGSHTSSHTGECEEKNTHTTEPPEMWNSVHNTTQESIKTCTLFISNAVYLTEQSVLIKLIFTSYFL